MAEYVYDSGGPLFHIGRYVLMVKRSIARPEKAIMYWKETLRQMFNIGVGSLEFIPINGANVLCGLCCKGIDDIRVSTYGFLPDFSR
jgi:hypothetical protein